VAQADIRLNCAVVQVAGDGLALAKRRFRRQPVEQVDGFDDRERLLHDVFQETGIAALEPRAGDDDQASALAQRQRGADEALGIEQVGDVAAGIGIGPAPLARVLALV